MALATQLLNGKIYVPRGLRVTGGADPYTEIFFPRLQVDFRLLSSTGLGANGVTVKSSFLYSYGQNYEQLDRYPLTTKGTIESLGVTDEGIDVNISYPDNLNQATPFAYVGGAGTGVQFDPTTYLAKDDGSDSQQWAKGCGDPKPYSDGEVSITNAFTCGAIHIIRVMLVSENTGDPTLPYIIQYTDVPVYLSYVFDLDTQADDVNDISVRVDLGEVDMDRGLVQEMVTYTDPARGSSDVKPVLTLEDEGWVKMDYKVKTEDLTKPTANQVILPYAVSGAEYQSANDEGVDNQVTNTADNGDGTTTLTFLNDVEDGFYVGIPYEMRYELGNIVFKKTAGNGQFSNTNRAIKDNLQTMTIAYSDSASFNVEIGRPKREDRIVQFTSDQLGYSNIGEAFLRTGEFRFHVRGKTRDTHVTITDTSVFPVQLQHIEIERNVISRSR